MARRELPHLALLWIVLALFGAYLALTHAGPWAPVIVAYGAATILAVAVVYLASWYGVWLYRNWRAPKREVDAIVERKWTREYDYDVPTRPPSVLAPILNLFSSPTVTVYQQWVFWVSFGVGNQELEFAVSEEVYAALVVGHSGVLTFKGERLVDFKSHIPQ